MPELLLSLQQFADELTRNFAMNLPAQPEDQLKEPVKSIARDAGELFGHRVEARTEVRVQGLGGRPDIGVTCDDLLCGYIELKAPGKGARPQRFSGADGAQWQKFKTLPNLIYTDGSEWTLFRTGQQIANVRMGDVTQDGIQAVSEENARALERMLRDFLLWQPVVPNNPKALAELLAPLCRLLREDVEQAVTEENSGISAC